MYAAEVRRSDAQMESAGVNCAKLVVQNIKEHSSDSSYERKITTAKSMGIEVGTKHDSRKLVPQLRTAMHSVLMKGITRLLVEPDPVTKRPRPFHAELADKATVMRETGQMHGLILMIDGNLVALFLSVLKVPDSSGYGLAKLLLQSLTEGVPLELYLSCHWLSCACPFAAWPLTASTRVPRRATLLGYRVRIGCASSLLCPRSGSVLVGMEHTALSS
eukprot:3805649-Prymnesium_polylepis.1